MTENITETKRGKHHIFIICSIIALLLLGFIGGQAFERARFRHSTRWQNNYERNFFNDRSRPQRNGMLSLGMMPGPFRSHAILGTVLSVNNDSVSVQDNNGNVEQAINISNSTVIQNSNGKGSVTDLQPGQRIAIFGRPTSNGQIDASLIRIFDANTPAPSISASPSPINQTQKPVINNSSPSKT